MSELKQLQDMMAEIIRIISNTNAIVEDLKAKVDGLETAIKENHLEILRELKALRTDVDLDLTVPDVELLNC